MKNYDELDNFTYLVVKANDLYFGLDLSKAEEAPFFENSYVS